jgi:Mn-dependent DtxR family transcriptional regulator
LTRPKRSGWKKRARKAIATAIDPHKNYTPSEVATVLNVSYDTAIRRMEKMGCVDMGTKERRYKRGKRMLRVTGRKLMDYLRTKVVD